MKLGGLKSYKFNPPLYENGERISPTMKSTKKNRWIRADLQISSQISDSSSEVLSKYDIEFFSYFDVSAEQVSEACSKNSDSTTDFESFD
jgi:hypothetical protein